MRLASLLPALAAAIVLGAPAAADAADVVPGKVIVRFKRDATATQRARVRAGTGTRFGTVLPGGSQTLRITDGQSVSKAVNELRAEDKVAYAVPDYRVHAAKFLPNDPGRGNGWQALQWNFIGPWGVNALQAWREAIAAHAPGGRGVIVAVIDSGVAYENRKGFRRAPDLHNTRFVAPYDWVDGDRHPDDEESHGTHVTGVIAQSTNNRYGVTGLAYGVKIMPLRVLDSQGNGDGADIARAVRYAVRHHARVINMSVEFDQGLRAGDIPEVISALHYAKRKGVTLVAASGNEGSSSQIAYPARDNDVISVGASTSHGCLADYSNGGSRLDLVAPGGGQDAALRGTAYDRAHCNPTGSDRTIVQQTLWGSVRHFRLVGFEGTSFAAPHVTAAAALLIATKRLGAHPTPARIRQRLMATARDIGEPGRDARYGAGLLDVGAALAR